MRLEDTLKAAYPITILPAEEGGYVAMFPDLPGLVTQADSLEDLVLMIEDAKRSWMEVAAEQGQDIPAPGSALLDPYDWGEGGVPEGKPLKYVPGKGFDFDDH